MAAAFTDPIPAAKPLGFRFTVGGGKKVSRNCCAATVLPMVSVAVVTTFTRAPCRCARNTAKTCPSGAARRLGASGSRRTGGARCVSSECGFGHLMGFIRGASAVAECQGMFKMQHDLDKVRFGNHWHHWHHSQYSQECLQMHLRSQMLAACRLHYAARDARPRAGPEVHPRIPAHLPPASSNRRRVARRGCGACRSVSLASSVCRVVQLLVSETCDSAPDGDAVMDPIALCTACKSTQ
jgi:hypothetical protein